MPKPRVPRGGDGTPENFRGQARTLPTSAGPHTQIGHMALNHPAPPRSIRGLRRGGVPCPESSLSGSASSTTSAIFKTKIFPKEKFYPRYSSKNLE